jgi:hypothetical protein
MLLPLLRAIVAIANLCLIAATRNLWFGDSGFPMIPMLGGLTDIPLWVDNTLATLLVSSLLLLAAASIRDAMRIRSTRHAPAASSSKLSSEDAELPGGRGWSEERTKPRFAQRLLCRGFLRRLSPAPATLIVVIAGTCLALLNQHRLQPWLYHLMLLCPILALDDRLLSDAPSGIPPSEGAELLGGRGWSEARAKPRLFSSLLDRGLLRRLSPAPATLVVLLTASVYFWSGILKCDRAFVEGHGQTFVSAIADVLGLSLKFWTPEQRSLAAAMLPVGELLVAISLLVPKTRRLGLWASLLMHGLLITAVGPWGMDQRPGVLIWNVLFISQNVLLLRHLANQTNASIVATPCATGSASASLEPGTGRASGTLSDTSVERSGSRHALQLARCVVIAAALVPLLRFGGWFDNWPSWAVYTAGNEHAYVLIAEDAVDRLPPDIRRFVQPRAMNDGWSWLRIDLWSIAAVDAPLYPQKRFFVACGLTVSQLPGMEDSVRILTESSADPLTGDRSTQSYAGAEGLQEIVSEFHLNLQSR